MGTIIQRPPVQRGRIPRGAFRGLEATCGATTTCSAVTKAIRVHRPRLPQAGSDLVETNTFNAQRISLADYGMELLGYELNLAGAAWPRAPRPSSISMASFVAGAGRGRLELRRLLERNHPLNITQRRACLNLHLEQANGLVDGGVTVIVETIFDTLNAKAAIFTLWRTLFDEPVDGAGRS